MADSKIPVEIEVRLDERSVGVSMESLKSRVKAQGREIGKSLSGAFSDISFMSDAVMKAEREKDKFLKKQLDADRAFNNAIRSEAKKTSDSQLSLIKQQEAAMWASYEVEKSGKKALEDHKASLAKKAAADQLTLIKQQEAAMWASYEVEKSGKKALEDHKASLAKKAAAEQLALIKQQEAAMWASWEKEKLGAKELAEYKAAQAKRAASAQAEYQKALGLNVMGQAPIKLFGSMADAMKRTEDAAKNQLTLWGHIDSRLRGIALLTTELTRAFFGLSLAVAAVGAPAIFGTRYLKNIEDAKMGLIGTLVTMGKFTEGTDKFQAALGLANDTIKSLEVNALKFGIPLDEILNVFRAITASGLQAGMTLEQIGKSAAIGTVAVRALGLDARQSVQELRDLFMGGIMPASSTLATSLGLRDSDIKKAKADAKAGIKDFYDFIMEQLQGYELVAAERTNTLSGSMDLFGMKLQRLFANEGVFTSIKDAVKGVSNSIAKLDKETNQLKFNPQLMDQLYQYNSVISKTVEWLGKLAELTLNNINHVVAFASSIALAVVTMSKWGILTLVAGWLKGISVAYKAAAADAIVMSISHSAAMTQIAGATAGAKAATLAAVGKTGLIGLAFFALYEAADMMGLLDGIFGRFEQRVDQARQKVKQMTTLEKQERLSVVDQNLKVLGTKSVEGYDPYSLFNDFKHAAKKAAVSKETGKVILEEEYTQLRDWQKAEYGQLESIQTLMRVMNAEREGIVEEIQKAMKPASVKVGAGGVGAFMKGSDALLKGSDFEKRREAESKMNSLLLQMQQGAVELDELYKKRINSNDLEKLNDREEQAKEIRSRIQAMAEERSKVEASMSKAEKSSSGRKDNSAEQAMKAYESMKLEVAIMQDKTKATEEGTQANTRFLQVQEQIKDLNLPQAKKDEMLKWAKSIDQQKEINKELSGQQKAVNSLASSYQESGDQAFQEAEQMMELGKQVGLTAEAYYDLGIQKLKNKGVDITDEIAARIQEKAAIKALGEAYKDIAKIKSDATNDIQQLDAEVAMMFVETEKQKAQIALDTNNKILDSTIARLEAEKAVMDTFVGPMEADQSTRYQKTTEAIAAGYKAKSEIADRYNKQIRNAELKDAKETVDKIEGTFKEAFMSIAESGTSGWRSMLNKFKSDFKKNIIEYIYKELAKPFVLNVIAQVTGAMGMSGVSQAASRMVGGSSGGGGNLLGMVGNANSLYNLAAAPGTASMMLAGNFAMSGVGQALGLSTATAAGYAAPVYASAAEGGALLSAGTGTAAGGLTAAGSALTTAAAAVPYVLAALAIADAVGAFGKRGGPQQGQYGSLGSEGYKSSFTMSGGDALGNQALAEVAYGQAATLLKMAGKDIAGLTIGQGYKLDPEGDSAGLAYRNISLNGRTITGGTFDGNNGAQWVGGSGDAEGAATYLAKLTSSEIEAIANTLNDAKLNGIIASLKKDFDDLADGMARYQTAQALQKGLLGAILSDEEKQKRHLAEVTEYLNKAFADINMAVPTTTEEFRKLIDGVDLTTVAGQTLLTQLGAMGDSFLFVVERAKAAQAQQEEYTNRLAVLQGTTTEQRLAREKELAGALTDGNKAILNQIYALEDHNAIIEKQKEAYQSLSETITTMVDAIKAQNGALKASQSGWQREYGGVDVQGAAERVAAAMGMSAGSVRGMSEADLRSLALSQSQTTTTTDKYADVSKEAMTEALRSGFTATSDALADAVRGGVLFDKLPALLDPFLKPLALNTDDAFQYVANHILSSWDAIMGDGGSGAGKTLAEIVDQFVQGQDLPTSHRVLAGKETTSNFDKLKQDWDDLIAAAAESAKAGAEAAGRMAEEAKNAAEAAAAAAKEAEDAFRQLAESVESVFQKYQDNIKKSRIDGMTSQEKVSYFTNQSAQALAALSGGTIQDSETLLKLHDDYIESVMNQYDVELEALEEQFKVTTDLLQTVADIKGWLDKIKLGTLSTLSPLQKLDEARRQYEQTLTAAQSGDIGARQNLTSTAEEYLSQAQSYYASSEDYANIFTNVLAQIGALSEPTKTTAEILAQIESQDKLFNTQANALRERMIVALETGQNRLVDALGSMKADFIAALGQASALAKAASAPPDYASQPYSTSDSPAAKDLVLAAVSSINPGFDYAGAAASNPALIEAWGKDLGIPGYAKGGLVSPGWAMVGEQGPELINFSQPGRVYTADQTSAAINGGNEEYLQQVISELQALIRQNGAASQAMIAELQAVKAELEDLRARTRLKEAA